MSVSNAIKAIKSGYFDTPFYLERSERIGLDLKSVSCEADFLKIPFLRKDDIRNSSAYSRTNVPEAEVFGIFSSNGTTGNKTFYIHSNEDHEKQAEFARGFYTPIGMEKNGLGAVLGPIGSPIMGHCMMWQFRAMGMGFTVCSDPSPENVLALIESLPVTDIATLPLVASFPLANEELRSITRHSTIKRLILGGDFLSEARRRLLEDAWGADVFNSFGMSEVFGPVGNECLMKNGFHYFDKDILLEVVSPDDGSPLPLGETGVGVYTTLWHKGFPLLRYYSEDLIRLVPDECECGCGLPRFEYFGRMTDCVKADSHWVCPRQAEEILLSCGVNDFRILIGESTADLLFDERGRRPGESSIRALEELLCRRVSPAAASSESFLARRGKPRYFLRKEER